MRIIKILFPAPVIAAGNGTVQRGCRVSKRNTASGSAVRIGWVKGLPVCPVEVAVKLGVQGKVLKKLYISVHITVYLAPNCCIANILRELNGVRAALNRSPNYGGAGI